MLNLGVVILLALSIGMGLQTTHRHQLLNVNPTLYCGMQVTCHE